MNRGTWWATVPGIAKSQTQLKQLTRHTRSKKCMNMIRLEVTTPSSEVYPVMKEKKEGRKKRNERGEREVSREEREREFWIQEENTKQKLEGLPWWSSG